MHNKNKKTVGSYYSATPVKWRKIGDSILYSCGVIGAAGLFGFDNLKDVFSPKELKIIIGGVLVLGFVGKFITNFFKEENKTV
jgi:hypothetical protein